MAVLAQEEFEVGTIGAAVQEADVIFANVDNVGITYVTGLNGTTKACNIAPATTGACRDTGFAALNKAVVRFIFKFASLPAADVNIAHMCLGNPNSGGIRVANLYLTTAGKLEVRNIFSAVGISSMTFVAGTEYALEWMFDGPNQQQSLRMFTNLALTATAAETIGPVDADAAGSVDWFQIGKMTNTTWASGLTIDRYKRANDWVSAPSGAAPSWNEEWVGTAGNDATIPVGWVKEGSNTASPKYQSGGPNIDQSYLNFASQAIGNRNLLSPQIPAGLATYERFYLMLNAKPDAQEQYETIWSAGSLGGTILFRLVASSGAGDTYDLELWADDDWDPTAPDPGVGDPPLPLPLGTISNIPIDSFHRVEISINATSGPAVCTVNVWKGARRNEASAPDNTISGSCLGTTLLRYRRYGQMLHPSVSATVSHKGVAFDGMQIAQNGSAIGPLPEAQQYNPPLNDDWQFYEWNGVDLIPLSLAGASTGGSPLEEVQFGEQEEPPTGDGLFTADPGLGSKLYVAPDTNASPRYNAAADFYNFELRTLSAGAGHPASDRCAPGCYRSFWGHNGGITAHPQFSTHGASSWDDSRKAAANTAISSWSYDARNAAEAATIFNGDHNSWMRNQLAPFITDIYERYGHLYTFDLGNESDAWTNAPNTARVPLWHFNVRKAARYIHFFLKDECDVPEEAFMVTVGTHTQATAYEHGLRHAKPIRLTETQWLNNSSNERGDAIYYYNPDWKNTRTVSGGYWSDAYDPNPADFVQPGEMDPYGYGRGPIHRMCQFNFYERSYEYANITTLAQFRNTLPSLEGGHPRTGNLFKWNRALSGGATPRLKVPSANANGIPVFIGELGLGVWCPLPTSQNAAVPKDTADAYCEVFMKDLVEKCNVVAYAKWRYQTYSYGSAGASNDGGSYTYNWKVGNGSTAGTGLFDPTNSNTKAEAAIFNTDYVADPPPWPNGTKRPPYINNAADTKRDRRGIDDVTNVN